MLHHVYRANDPEAMATARWFCQALRNFSPGSAVRLVGDEDGTYRWLAEQSGLTIADTDACDGSVLIGMDAAQSFDYERCAGPNLLLFVPFTTSKQGELNALLQRTNAAMPIKGHQAVPLNGDRGVLIARCEQPAAEAIAPPIA